MYPVSALGIMSYALKSEFLEILFSERLYIVLLLCILSCIWVKTLNPDGTAWARVKHLQLRIWVYAVCYIEHKPSWDEDLPFSLHLEVISTTNNTFILKVFLVPCQTEGGWEPLQWNLPSSFMVPVNLHVFWGWIWTLSAHKPLTLL